LAARLAAQFAQRLRFDLPDPFPSYGKTPAHLLESAFIAIVKSEPQLDDHFLARTQSLQDRLSALPQIIADNNLGR